VRCPLAGQAPPVGFLARPAKANLGSPFSSTVSLLSRHSEEKHYQSAARNREHEDKLYQSTGYKYGSHHHHHHHQQQRRADVGGLVKRDVDVEGGTMTRNTFLCVTFVWCSGCLRLMQICCVG